MTTMALTIAALVAWLYLELRGKKWQRVACGFLAMVMVGYCVLWTSKVAWGFDRFFYRAAILRIGDAIDAGKVEPVRRAIASFRGTPAKEGLFTFRGSGAFYDTLLTELARSEQPMGADFGGRGSAQP